MIVYLLWSLLRPLNYGAPVLLLMNNNRYERYDTCKLDDYKIVGV